MFRILLVDDNPIIVDGIETMIHDHVPEIFSVSKAYDGRQALEMLTETYFHLIISDIKMPQLDGISLLNLIQKEHLPTTVIILSGYDDYMFIRCALRLGAYDYLLKPVNIQNLSAMLREIRPTLKESSLTLSKDHLSCLSLNVGAHNYFDLPGDGEKSLSLDELKEALDRLQVLVLELDSDGVYQEINQIFFRLSENLLTEDQLKNAFSDFAYALVQKNSYLIKVMAQYKLSDNDLTSQIKNQPHLSQLKEKFCQILLLYISHLELLQKDNEEYVAKKAQAYIQQHYSEPLLLSDIAALFKLHPNYFSLLFKKQLHVTVRDYILQLRISKAKEMMADPSLRLLDIALAVGYQDGSHFNRAFKNVTGLSPTQYRINLERKI
ncbi:MAG: response regulator [Hungatella sp.]|nr:response regulator [Hungatella sp.]